MINNKKNSSLLKVVPLQCTVEPDPQNLASALLEGAWEVDESWSLQLAQELEPEAEATQTLSFYRNDSIADILPAEVCQYYPQRIYMAGELSWERKDGSSNGKNPQFHYLFLSFILAVFSVALHPVDQVRQSSSGVL